MIFKVIRGRKFNRKLIRFEGGNFEKKQIFEEKIKEGFEPIKKNLSWIPLSNHYTKA